MDTTLLNSDYINKNDNIDLIPLLRKFESSFKFHQNHQDLRNKIKPQTVEEIEHIFNLQ